MLRPTWKPIAVLTAGVVLTLAAGLSPEPPVAAQETPGTQSELMRLLRSDGLTRGQLASLYASLAGGPNQPPACVVGQEVFEDVPASHPFCAFIEQLFADLVTGGCGASPPLYCPDQPVTRGQMAVFLEKAMRGTAVWNPHRPWGEGRASTVRYGTTGEESGLCSNGAVAFGLSATAVQWGDAAAACPAGTWVCSLAERGGAVCDTARPETNSGCDERECDGTCIDWQPDLHPGWVDLAGPPQTAGGYNVQEGGGGGTDPTCNVKPVWCCSALP